MRRSCCELHSRTSAQSDAARPVAADVGVLGRRLLFVAAALADDEEDVVEVREQLIVVLSTSSAVHLRLAIVFPSLSLSSSLTETTSNLT